MRFNPPPHWPKAPAGWHPPDGWQPPTGWEVPAGWQLWLPDDHPPAIPQPVHSSGGPTSPPDEARHRQHNREVSAAHSKVPLFGARQYARDLEHRVTELQDKLRELGAMDAVELSNRTEELRVAHQRTEAEQRAELKRLKDKMAATVSNLRAAERHLVDTKDTLALQEVGVYEYSHPLRDAIAYKDRLARLQRQIKEAAKANGDAVTGTTSWTVNNSLSEGRKLVRDMSKLLLRAYNAEADTLVRGLKPYRLEAAVDRLNKTVATVERLGRMMDIRISHRYHDLRIDELRLTADYRAKVAEEKEAEREEKARLREERKVHLEIEKEKERLEKERTHYANALAALRVKGDDEAIQRLEAQLANVDRAIADVDYRAANQRAGYVYVISNIGSLGQQMIKVGMTRRLEPQDRIRELSDASVPFNFDVHALFFADDAVGIEAAMHRALADRRVNQVNMRREYFYATPGEAKDLLLELAGDLLHFNETPEALEFRQSGPARRAAGIVLSEVASDEQSGDDAIAPSRTVAPAMLP